MNTTLHPISPEEIMAFVDGELPEAERQTISAHVEECADCASLVAQFQSISSILAEWKIEPVPAEMETAVLELASRENSATVTRETKLVKTSYAWLRRPWVLTGSGVMAAALLAVSGWFSSHSERHEMKQSQYELANTRPAPPSQYDSLSEPKASATAMMYDSPSGLPAKATAMMAPPPPAPSPVVRQRVAGGAVGGDSVGSGLIAPVPMIARSVSLTLVVKDVAASRSLLDTILTRYNGYPAQLTVNTPENAARAFQASLRIPAPQLASALRDLRALGRVENETQSGEEVTQQHTDLVARLKTARDTEERLQTILTQRTGKIEDVLQVEEEIARVRGEIEGMESEQKALEHRVDFTSVDVQLTEEYKAQLNSLPTSRGNQLHNALVEGYRHASDTLLGIVLIFAEYGPTLLIILAIVGLPALLMYRRYLRILSGS